jgi:hypothetical protein
MIKEKAVKTLSANVQMAIEETSQIFEKEKEKLFKVHLETKEQHLS